MHKNKISNSFLNFFKSDATSGIILLVFAIIAIFIANSNFATGYEHLLHTKVTIGPVSMSLLHWINDGLMAIFFFVVGMEIKEEMLIGELKSFKKAILPIVAALGGMVVPSLIYSIFNFGQPTSTGFGIPMSTDIAFSLGVLALVAKRAPKGIVVFLTALAVVDDLGAIIVIALFYSTSISWTYLLISGLIVVALIAANKLKVKFTALFIILGIVLWYTMLKSGIHATFAGVILGLTIPGTRARETFKNSMLHKLEHKFSPWSAFLIMPIFALTNANITVNMDSLSTLLTSPVSLGIIGGLFLGKQLGIFGVSMLLVKLNIAKLPSQVTKAHIYGASILAGIGFTMSIFVSNLAFSDPAILSLAKISILIASVLSALCGTIAFKLIEKKIEIK